MILLETCDNRMWCICRYWKWYCWEKWI